MAIDVYQREDLSTVVESKKCQVLSQTISSALLDEAKERGWIEEKKPGRVGKRSSKKAVPVQVTKAKPYGRAIADRVWLLLYNMGFAYLSGDEALHLQSGQHPQPQQQVNVDIISVDDEVGLVICVHASPQPRPANTCFIRDLDLYKRALPPFTQTINKQLPGDQKNRKSAFILFQSQIELSEEEQKAADERSVVIFNEHDLVYYEDLVARLGTAAKYQFLAEVFENRKIPNLQIEVPAIKLRAGQMVYYVFAMRPDYLLKIAFIAHHKPGRKGDFTTMYQRMANKERLDEMQAYVRKEGIYPTNIVVSLNPGPTFKRYPDQQKAQSQAAYHAELGTLELSSYYKSAWIIDGQHRLLSYAQEERASTSSLVVIAFEGLPPGQQTQFFHDINSKQARIDDRHLAELQREIYQDASNPAERILSLIPQALPLLDEQKGSPLQGRILFKGKRNKRRAISSAMITTQLLDDVFTRIDYGVFYVRDDDNATVERAVYLLNAWFASIRECVSKWWDVGTGGLATEEAVMVFLIILKKILRTLVSRYNNLSSFSNQALVDLLQSYANELSQHLATFSEVQRQDFRTQLGLKQGPAQCAESLLEILREKNLFLF